MNATASAKESAAKTVAPRQLPFCCPPPGGENWNKHPRVFLQLSAAQPEVSCPYCGARYRLQTDNGGDNNNGGEKK